MLFPMFTQHFGLFLWRKYGHVILFIHYLEKYWISVYILLFGIQHPLILLFFIRV